MYKIFITKAADKSVTKIPKDYQRQFAKLIQSLSNNPFELDIKLLKGDHKVTHRIRMGTYRVFIKITIDKKEAYIVDIRRRTSKTYRKN